MRIDVVFGNEYRKQNMNQVRVKPSHPGLLPLPPEMTEAPVDKKEENATCCQQPRDKGN